MSYIHRLGLPFWSIVIAIVLWAQVHGQGMGSVRLDVALQVRDVPENMMIVNDLPDQVSITVSGLQALLNSLDTQALFVSVDASSLNMPGVIEQALDIETIDLPAGLKVEKIQPDSVQLQVDHIVKRTIKVQPIFDLAQGWKAEHVVITPSVITLSGPEVWLSTMDKVETSALRLNLKQGLFDVQTTVVPLSGQGIHTLEKDVKIRVRGDLVWTRTVQNNDKFLRKEALSTSEDHLMVEDGASIVPIPEGGHGQLIKAKKEIVPASIVPVPAQYHMKDGVEKPVQIEVKEEVAPASIVPVPAQYHMKDAVEKPVQIEVKEEVVPASIVPVPAQYHMKDAVEKPVQIEVKEEVVPVSVVPVIEDVYTGIIEEEPRREKIAVPALIEPDRQLKN
ncbi:MAG: CdaR family protein [Ghiorsea sp.]|nr:CdaR family protein [Ghiorsea sp.]